MHAVKARLLAAIAGAVLLPLGAPSLAAPAPVVAAAETRLPHISIVSIGVSNGKGPTVVLIPGLASPRAVWDGIAPELARTHRVLLVQINGFAGDAPGANLAPGVIAGAVADLDGYLVANHIADAQIIGHSLGGLAALLLARDHPTHVSRLMIVDSFPFIGVLFGATATVATLDPTAKAMAAQMTAGYGKPADMATQQAIAQRLALKPESVATVAAWGAKADPRVVGQAFYEDMTMDLRPDLPALTTPITLLYPWSARLPAGEAGTLYRQGYAAAPHVTFVAIGDSAHFVMLDQPAAFAAAVRQFVAGR